MDGLIEFLIVICIALVLTFFAFEGGYREGGIDVASGKVKYELVMQEDKTTEWVKR